MHGGRVVIFNPLEWNPLFWACLFAVPFYLLTALCLGNRSVGIAVGVGVGLFVALRRNTLITSLKCRAESKETPILWDVLIDRVRVGSLTDADVAAMRLRVLSDISTYTAQLMNLGMIALKAVWSFFCVLCLMLFLLCMSILVVAPLQLPKLLHAALLSNPTHLIYLGLLIFTSIWSITSLSVWIGWIGGRSYFGFTNYFSASLTNLNRDRCRCSSSGPLVLVRAAGSSVQFNSEISQF